MLWLLLEASLILQNNAIDMLIFHRYELKELNHSHQSAHYDSRNRLFLIPNRPRAAAHIMQGSQVT